MKTSYSAVILAILSVIIFLLVGCEEGTTTTSKAFIGGDSGIEMEFLSGAPPDEVYDQDFPFGITVKLENVGEWNIDAKEDVTIGISGFDPAEFGKTTADLTKNVPDEMTGKRRVEGEDIRGTISSVEFSDLQYRSGVIGQIPVPVRATVCYEYGTRVNSDICVLEDLLGSKREENPICDPNTARDSESSGAPVKVTSVKEAAISKDKISITFDIEHIGTGIVTKKDVECDNLQKDKVYVKVDTGISGLSCNGIEGSGTEGFVSLYDGKRTILCNQVLPADRSDFTKNIKITLEYGYKDIIDKEIIVKQTTG